MRAVLRTALRPHRRARSPEAAHVHGGGAARSVPFLAAPRRGHRSPTAAHGAPHRCAGRVRAPCLKGTRMAIYHLNARGCSPSTGAGAVRNVSLLLRKRHGRASPAPARAFPPRPPSPCPFAASLTALGPSARAPRWRDFAPPNHPTNHCRYRYRISDSHGRGRSTSPMWSFVICHLSHYFSDVVSEK